jgi:shikimate kinase
VLIILIGLRGAGKTAIGRALAARLSLPFVDLDDLTAKAMGAPTVGEAFRSGGQAAFRRAEAEALQRAVMAQGQVLALGGGTPIAPGAADTLRGSQRAGAKLVYLRASAQTLRSRLENQTHDRPSLTGADPLAEIDAVLAQRDPMYLALADTVVGVDGLSEDQVLSQVLAAVQGS